MSKSLLDGYNEKAITGNSLLSGYVEPELPPVEPEAGLIPMAKRIGAGAVQGAKNLPKAIVDFAHQTVDAGKQEFQQGYNPVEAFTAGSLGAIQGGANLVEGIWNLPGDLANAYYGKEKVKATHPLTQWIPEQLAKTQVGRNHLEGVEYLQQKYPLANMLASELGEEVPAMLAGATLAKYGVKAGKLAKTADKLSDVGYGKLAGSSAVGGLSEGFLVDPSQGQAMSSEDRLAGRFTNAYTGAVTAPTLNIGIKAGADVAPKAVKATKEVSAQIVKSLDSFFNAPTSFDLLKEMNKTVAGKVSPAVLSNAQIRNINNDLRSYANLLEIQQAGEYYGQKLDDAQLKAVKRQIYKLEDSFKAQNDFINQNLKQMDLDTLMAVQQNIQGRFNATQIQDGYNVYGVPVTQNAVDKFNSKYDSFNTQANLDKIQAENRKRLENYKQKLIAEGKIKAPIVDEVPESILDGYEETVTQEIKQEKPQTIEETENKNPANLSGYDMEDVKKLIPFISKDDIKIGQNEKIDFSQLEKVDDIKLATHHDAVNGGFYRVKSQENEVDSIENLDIKKHTYTMKSGKPKEVDYVDTPPKGWVKDDMATTAPQGFVWYNNNKSLLERKSILVKENVENTEVLKGNIEKTPTNRYKYDVGNMAMKRGMSKAQREYIVKTILDEYTGNLYNGIKTEHIFDKDKNPDIETDDYHKQFTNEDVINLFIPDTNARFTIYKNPQAIRTLFDKLGIKLSDNISGAEKYTNKENPTIKNFDLKVFDGEYISDGNIAIKTEYANIQDKAVLDKVMAEEITQGYKNKISQLVPKNVKPIQDTNTIAELDKFKGKVRIFNNNGKQIAIDEKYAKIFDDYQLHQGENIFSAIVAKKQNGDVVGLVMPITPNQDGTYNFSNIKPNKKQSTFDKKVYKDVEPAFTNYGNNKYDKTAESRFAQPRTKLETETQAISKVKKQNKKDRTKNLKDAKAYDTYLKDNIRAWDSEIRKRRYEVGKNLTEFINNTDKLGKEWNINGSLLREVMPFLRERTAVPEKLNKQDVKYTYNKLTDIQKQKLTKMADEIAEKFDVYWDEYRASHADETNEGSKEKIENHISHIWDLDRKQKSLMTNYFATKSRFAKERTIKTLFDGIEGIKLENGETLELQPKILDYAQILQVQVDNLIKTTFDKLLADEVKAVKTYDGVNLVLPASKAPSDWIPINHPALNKTLIRPVTSEVGEVITPELENILAEMGVAIGRRLNPGATKGVYRHKLQPEISVQRWFSNKTLAHEIGHAIDYKLGLRKRGFAVRHKAELLDLNEERIARLSKFGKSSYAKSDAELIAELFGFLFNDPKLASEIAPNATMEAIELLSKNDTLKKLLPDNFDWENAKNILEKSTVEMFKTAVKVHPDIANTLKTVFDNVGDRTAVGKMFDDANAVLKQAQLGFSGFHAVALSESALANMGVCRVAKSLNPVKLFNAVKNNDWDIYKKDKIAKQAIEDGLQIGATLDINRNLVEGIIDDVGRWIEKKIPVVGKPLSLPVKGLAKLQKLNNKVLWDYLHNNYKLECYEMLIKQEEEKGIVSKRRRQEIAHWVNDSFGGQVWENLGIKIGQRQFEQRALLSPDWLRSTTRQALAVLSTEKGHKAINYLSRDNKFWQKAKEIGKEWGIFSVTDDVTASGMRGRVARRFWLNAMIQYTIYTNVLNAMFREKDRKEHPELYPKKMTAKDYSTWANNPLAEEFTERLFPYVFLGRNKDGSERYWRLGKQFRELPELITKPIEKLGGKASPMAQLTSQTFTSKSVGGFENKDLADKRGLERVPALGKTYAEAFLPFSFNSAVNPKKDFTSFDFFAPTSRGMSFYKGRELYKEAMLKGDKEMVKTVTQQLKRNQLDHKKIAQSAIQEIRKEAWKEAMQKVEKKKQKKRGK